MLQALRELRLTGAGVPDELPDAPVHHLAGVALEASPAALGQFAALRQVGAVRFDGQNVGSLGDADRTRIRLRALGFVFQRFHLLNHLTAVENVMLPLEAAGAGTVERYERACSILESVGLGDRLLFRPAQLSGGQRQRVAVARAAANSPSVVLADEPTGELHSEDTRRVLNLFRALNAQGRTVVIVTHDPDVAAIARRRIEIRDGSVHE